MSGPFGAGALQYFSGEKVFYPFSLSRSLKFNDDDKQMLSRTFASAGNRRTWAWSGWVKRANIGNTHPLFVAGSSGSSVFQFAMQTSTNADRLVFYNYTGSYNLNIATTQVLRDVSAWYHIVLLMNTTQSTSSNRVKLYINGGLVSDFASSSYPSQNFETLVNSAASHRIGRNFDTAVSTKSLDGYISEVNFIDSPIFTAATTSGSATVTGISSTATLKQGMAVSSSTTSVIPDGTTIQSIDSSTQITLSANATATNGSVALTFSPTIDFFGETKQGIWVANNYLGPYGTNGFHLDFRDDTTVEGFNTVTWTSDNTDIFLRTGFDPDFVWYKRRDAAGDHYLIDSLRGVGGGSHALNTNNTDAEGGGGNADALGTNGFTINAGGSSETQVAWAWKAGGKPSATNSAGQGNVPTAGSVKIDGANSSANLQGTIPATKLSANTTYGFSVVTYTGTGSNATVAHGLGATPKWIIIKALTEPTGGVHFGSDQGNWVVYHTGADASAPEEKYLLLNETNVIGDSAVAFNDTAPTNEVFSIGTVVDVNENGDNYVAYCWCEKTGFSKFGSYVGNGSTGQTITTGFKVGWLMVKRTDVANSWYIVDNTRSPNTAAGNDDLLYANLNNLEGSTNDFFTLTSTGFTLNSDSPTSNASGGNYIYMAFADTRDFTFFGDQSGNGNNFTPINLDYRNSVPDVPTDNRPTFNALVKDLKHATTLSNGNKTINFSSGSSGFSGTPMTIYRNEGQAYCEVELNNTYNGNSGDSQTVFVVGDDKDFSDIGSGDSSNFEGSYNAGGSGDAAADITQRGVSQGTPTKFRTAGDRVGVYLNYTTGKGFFALNGTVQTVNGTPDIANGTNPHFTFTPNMRLTVGVGGIHAGTPATLTLKDHPDDWEYTPPTGYTAFSTAELPDPAIDPNNNEQPQDHFGVLTWTGNGTGGRSIIDTESSVSGTVNFTPDWVWIKDRVVSNNHVWVNLVRGVSKLLFSNSSIAEITGATQVSSFNDGGFTNGASTTYVNENGSSNTYVAWNWKAGGTEVSNGDGNVASVVSANQDAGISIVAYTATGSGDITVGHGLGAAPELIFGKVGNQAYGWNIYASVFGSSNGATFGSSPSVQPASSVAFGQTAPTATVFTAGRGGQDNMNYGAGDEVVAWCFASKEGYQKIGTFTGVGGADNQFVYLGFRPAFFMVKRINSTGDWVMYDSLRDPFNVGSRRMSANLNSNELSGSSNYGIDFLSNGVKWRSGQGDSATDNGVYLYWAIAEQPFKYSNAR